MRLSKVNGLQAQHRRSTTCQPHGARVRWRTIGHRPSLTRRVTEKEAELAATESFEASLAQMTKQILQTDPQARESLRRYEEAVLRLEKAKAASEELDRMFAEASRGAAESDQRSDQEERQQANERLADAEVAAAERLLAAAELEYDTARRAQQQWAAAASDVWPPHVQVPERVESVKAAVIAAAAGLFAALPLVALSGQGAEAGGEGGALSAGLSLLSAVAACFLFGVTYRYAVRSDSSNRQLRLGVVVAFGLVRTSGAADVLQAAADQAGGVEGGGPLSLSAVVVLGALYALESLLLFGFASVAMETAFNQGLLKRFSQAS